jgi:hypothetical protein
MLLFLFSKVIHSLQCPAGIQHLYNSATNLTLDKDEWFYFYSDYILLGDTLTVRVLPKSNQVNLYTGNELSCPGPGSTALQSGLPVREWSTRTIGVSSSLGLQIFGIQAQGQTEIVISVEGENPNNADRTEWLLIAELFLVVVLLLLVAMFVHAILARGKVHYQVDVGE